MSALAAASILLGAFLVFVGSLGLLTLRTFYERVHAPTLGATLGTGLILLGSLLSFSHAQGGPLLHEILIGAFMLVSTPVTYLLLVRAATQRDRMQGSDPLPPSSRDEAR
jgi:multicomponent K+:H+ antiporter subunit G